MNFIKKVFDSRNDESVHMQFQKFSKGEFRNRALVKAKKTGSKFIIFTSAEFANDLVREVAGKLGSKGANIKGVIVSTLDLHGLDYQNKKQFMGIKQYVIDKEMSGNDILKMMNEFPKAFFGLSFSADNTELKIKPKAPKSAKPSTKSDEAIKPDFCKLITEDARLGESFVFEKPNFKTAEIAHTFVITDIITPNELKNENDFAKVREMSKRKGKVVRKALIDGEERRSEKEFLA